MAIFTWEPGWKRAFQSKRCCGRVGGSRGGSELFSFDHGKSFGRPGKSRGSPELFGFDHGKSFGSPGESFGGSGKFHLDPDEGCERCGGTFGRCGGPDYCIASPGVTVEFRTKSVDAAEHAALSDVVPVSF